MNKYFGRLLEGFTLNTLTPYERVDKKPEEIMCSKCKL